MILNLNLFYFMFYDWPASCEAEIHCVRSGQWLLWLKQRKMLKHWVGLENFGEKKYFSCEGFGPSF